MRQDCNAIYTTYTCYIIAKCLRLCVYDMLIFFSTLVILCCEWSNFVDPQCGDMFENGNFRRRRRMKRPFRATSYPKTLFTDGYHVAHVGQHVAPHMQPLPLGARNYFSPGSPYSSSYPRYDTWVINIHHKYISTLKYN